MTIKKALWAVFAVAAAVIIVIFFVQNTAPKTNAGTSPPTATAAQAQSTPQGVSATPAEVDQANGFSQLYPDAEQAPELGTDKAYEHKNIKAPSVPAVDVQKPASVTEAFLTVYNSREGETDQSWQEKIKPWVTPDLSEELSEASNDALAGKTPAAVSAVKVGKHVADWGSDTPLRWSHHVEVTVDTQDNGTYLLQYRMQAQLTDQGWLVNTVKLDAWNRVGK